MVPPVLTVLLSASLSVKRDSAGGRPLQQQQAPHRHDAADVRVTQRRMLGLSLLLVV